MRSAALALATVFLLALGAPALGADPEPAADEETRAMTYGVTPLLEEIRTRQMRLDRREREIDDRERQLDEFGRVVAERLAELEKISEVVEKRISAWEEANGDTIRRLAKIYAAMPPGRAAPLLEQLDVELATQIVAKMKHKQSAAVLGLVSDDRALMMSRKVAHPLGMKPANPKSENR